MITDMPDAARRAIATWTTLVDLGFDRDKVFIEALHSILGTGGDILEPKEGQLFLVVTIRLDPDAAIPTMFEHVGTVDQVWWSRSALDARVTWNNLTIEAQGREVLRWVTDEKVRYLVRRLLAAGIVPPAARDLPSEMVSQLEQRVSSVVA